MTWKHRVLKVVPRGLENTYKLKGKKYGPLYGPLTTQVFVLSWRKTGCMY
jgi:hypothetical protein